MQQHSSLADPDDVQAASRLLTAHLPRFKCIISPTTSIFNSSLYPPYASSSWKTINNKAERPWCSTFPPIATSPTPGLCHTFGRPEPLSAPGCHRHSETPGCLLPKGLTVEPKVLAQIPSWEKTRELHWMLRIQPSMRDVTHKGVMKITVQNFTARGKKRKKKILNAIKRPHCVIKWGFADREERDWLGKQPKASNTTAEGMPGTETQLQGKGIRACLVIGCLSFSYAAQSPPKELYTPRLVTCLHSERLTWWKVLELASQNHWSSKNLGQGLQSPW